MKFAIFTLVEHTFKDNLYYGYAPYIREMDIWNEKVDEVIVVAPKSKNNEISAIDLPYKHKKITFVEVPSFHVKTLPSILKILISIPSIFYKMFKVMKNADHLHLRCPSNVAALAAVVQILFPSKNKTTKYAGNWDPNSKQPRGYKFQKWVLSNTFLTKNMKVLVYGEWKNQSKNVIPFISATYYDNEKVPFKTRNYNAELQFVFAGALVHGKRPLLTIKIIEELNKKGINAKLHLFGEGIMRNKLEAYIQDNELNDIIILYGNQEKKVIRETLKIAHFSILPSKSEGWPKAIAEGMFFGAIPISTKISCLEWMLNYGKRGILIEPDLYKAVQEIEKHLEQKQQLNAIAENALNWSQQYTLDTLEEAIKSQLQ